MTHVKNATKEKLENILKAIEYAYSNKKDGYRQRNVRQFLHRRVIFMTYVKQKKQQGY